MNEKKKYYAKITVKAYADDIKVLVYADDIYELQNRVNDIYESAVCDSEDEITIFDSDMNKIGYFQETPSGLSATCLINGEEYDLDFVLEGEKEWIK